MTTPCCTGMRAARRSATSSIAGSSRVLEFAHCVVQRLQLALDVALPLRARSPRPTASTSTAWRSASTSMRSSLALARVAGSSSAGLLRAVEHDAVDEAHHVERRPVDVDVGAQPERRRHRHVGRADGGDDPELAGHVVGRRQHVAERRAAQHEASAVGAGDGERQVGAAAADERGVERADGAVDVGLQPGADLLQIESFEHRGHDGSGRGTGGPARPRSQPGRPTPTTLPQLTVATLTVVPLFGAWTCWPPPR